MEVILHIGYPKTGSSAIQSHIHTNRGWLQKNGIYIPESGYGRGLGHAFLFGLDAKSPPPRGGDQALRGEDRLGDLEEELRQAEQRGFRRALISWEGLVSIQTHAIQSLCNALLGHSITLLAYVREQSALFQSAILQHVEAATNSPLISVFGNNNLSEISTEIYDFDATLSSWQTIFTDQIDVRIRVYEKRCLIDGNIVIDFLSWIGLSPDAGFCLQSKQVNHSLDSRTAALLLVAQAAGLDRGGRLKLSRALSQVIGRRGARDRKFLGDDELDLLRERYRMCNLRLFEKFKPENVDSDTSGFSLPEGKSEPEVSAIEFDFLRDLYNELTAPAMVVWQGDTLVSHKLVKIAGSRNQGWRGAEVTGVWSVGPASELAFLLPELDPVEGPKALKLTIAGRYFGENINTRVVVNGNEEILDLKSTELCIDIDERVLRQGIRIELLHSSPQIPNEQKAGLEENGIAFKLEWLSYSFIWGSEARPSDAPRGRALLMLSAISQRLFGFP